MHIGKQVSSEPQKHRSYTPPKAVMLRCFGQLDSLQTNGDMLRSAIRAVGLATHMPERDAKGATFTPILRTQFIRFAYRNIAVLLLGLDPRKSRKISAKKEEANTALFERFPFIYAAIGNASAKLPQMLRLFRGSAVYMNGVMDTHSPTRESTGWSVHTHA